LRNPPIGPGAPDPLPGARAIPCKEPAMPIEERVATKNGSVMRHRMPEAAYLAGLRFGREKLGVDNPFNEPEFVRDMERGDTGPSGPVTKVKSVPRNPRVHMGNAEGGTRSAAVGKLTRFGRVTFHSGAGERARFGKRRPEAAFLHGVH
jgi:hypothetical protein